MFRPPTLRVVIALTAALALLATVAVPSAVGRRPPAGPKSCADYRQVVLARCSPLVLVDNMPGDDYNKTGRRMATSPGWYPYDQDEAQAVSTGSENVLLDSLELPLEFLAGTNALDVSLLRERSRIPLPGFEPDETAVVEHWLIVNQVPSVDRGGIVHVASVLHPKLLAGTRYWVYISVPQPASGIAWYSGSLQSGEQVWIAERNTETGFVWSVADTIGGFGLRVTVLH